LIKQKEQQMPRILRRKNFVIAGLVLVLGAATAGIVIFRANSSAANAPANPPVGAAVPSQFSFTGAADWWQGATNKTSMALFHKYDCFTSVEHKTGTVDVASELQKMQDMLSSDGYTVAPGSTQTLTLQTTAGPKQYELHQSSVTTPADANKVKGGQEFGYIQLSAGYIKVMGYCDTADQLPATLPALQGIKFNQAK
jgi:hypothetical protein